MQHATKNMKPSISLAKIYMNKFILGAHNSVKSIILSLTKLTTEKLQIEIEQYEKTCHEMCISLELKGYFLSCIIKSSVDLCKI